jgi:hypothetical protein
LFVYDAEMVSSPLLLWPLIGLFYQPWMTVGDDFGAIRGINLWQGKMNNSEEICPSTAVFTIHPLGLHTGSNLVHRSGKLEINRPSYGTANRGSKLKHNVDCSPSFRK